MEKGQVSIEYLLMLSAAIGLVILIITLFLVFIVVPQQEMIPVNQDKTNCNLGGGKVITRNVGGIDIEQYVEVKVELGGYIAPYDPDNVGNENNPREMIMGNKVFDQITSGLYPASPDDIEVCQLQNEYRLMYNDNSGNPKFYLDKGGINWFIYTML